MRYKDYHMDFFISAMLSVLESAHLPSTSRANMPYLGLIP